jgi:hypothetical protein
VHFTHCLVWVKKRKHLKFSFRQNRFYPARTRNPPSFAHQRLRANPPACSPTVLLAPSRLLPSAMTCTRAAATRSNVQALRRHQPNSPPLELAHPFCPSPFFLCHRTRHLLASSIRCCLAFPRTCLCRLVRVAGLQLRSSCGLRAPRCCLRAAPRRSSGVAGGTESQDRGVQRRELGRGGRQREQGFFTDRYIYTATQR